MIFLAVLIWVLVGGVFGYARAKAKYQEEIDRFPALMQENPAMVIRDAKIEAAITFSKYMFLGFLAAVAYLLFIVMVIADKESGKK